MLFGALQKLTLCSMTSCYYFGILHWTYVLGCGSSFSCLLCSKKVCNWHIRIGNFDIFCKDGGEYHGCHIGFAFFPTMQNENLKVMSQLYMVYEFTFIA